MRKYELMIIYDPSLEEDGVTKELSKTISLIEKENGEIVGKEILGIKKLAYSIKHLDSGYYCLLNFDCDDKVISEINRINKINDRVLRHIITRRND